MKKCLCLNEAHKIWYVFYATRQSCDLKIADELCETQYEMSHTPLHFGKSNSKTIQTVEIFIQKRMNIIIPPLSRYLGNLAREIGGSH